MTIDEEFRLLKSEYRIFDSGDPWGDSMHWLFTVADELHFREGFTPEHWKFRPSPAGPANDPDDHATTLACEVGAEALVKFGNLLHRYCRLLKHKGLDY